MNPSSTTVALNDARGAYLTEYYTLETWKSISFTHGPRGFWRRIVPSIAIRYEFLQHSLMSLAAMHLSIGNRNSRTDLISDASRHYFKASQLFRKSLANIDSQNSHAILAFALVVVMYNFFNSANAAKFDPLPPIYALRSALSLVTGGLADLISQGPLQRLVEDAKDLIVPLDSTTLTDLDNIEHTIRESCKHEESRQICLSALLTLRESYSYFGIYPRSWLQVAWWTRSLDERFLRLVKLEHPQALMVLARWCRMLQGAPNMWFWRDWSNRAVSTFQYSGQALEHQTRAAEKVVEDDCRQGRM